MVALALLVPVLMAVSSRRIERVSIQDSGGDEVLAYGESHALLVGVSRYTHGWPSLTSIPREVAELEDVLLAHGFDVRVVMDPSSDALEDAFKDFIDDYGYERDNRLFFFFSGHGHTRDGGRKGYLVPGEAPDPRRDEKAFLRKALPMTQVVAWAKTIESRHALFVFDSCFSGTVFQTKALPEFPPYIARNLGHPVRQFITAGGAGEEVPAKSVFSPALVRALRGSADLNTDGYIVGTELGMYLRDSVVGYATGQTPQFGKIKDPDLDSGDFVFKVPEVFREVSLAETDNDLPEPPPSPSLELPEVGRLAQVRQEWADYQGDMDEAYEQVFDLDESLYVQASKKAEAWRRFLGAFAEDNPFSEQDDHFRAVALTRLGQLENTSSEETASEAPSLPVDGPADADPGAYVVYLGEDAPLGDSLPVLHFRSGHHLGTLRIDSRIRPCADERHPLRGWSERTWQTCWELLPYVEDVGGTRNYFQAYADGYYPRPAERFPPEDGRLLRVFAFTADGQQPPENLEVFRFAQCIASMNDGWAAVRPDGCLVMASGERYRETRLCGERNELCVFFDQRY